MSNRKRVLRKQNSQNFTFNSRRVKLKVLTLLFASNQWTGFYMITASVMKELIRLSFTLTPSPWGKVTDIAV